MNKPLPESDGPPVQKKAKGNNLFRRYQASVPDLDNAESIEKHIKAISSELLKSKPRDSVLLPLMKSTFAERRLYILNDAISVAVTLDKYPALSCTAVVS